MLCINCLSTDTRVINSRPHKKSSTVWRRRHCDNCQTTFTTRETTELALQVTKNGSKRSLTYSKAILAGSIFVAVQAAGLKPDKAYWLVDTVEDELIRLHRQKTASEGLTTAQIKAAAYKVLLAFNPAAAIAYGSTQGLSRMNQTLKPKRNL